jgi:hypothetical protein
MVARQEADLDRKTVLFRIFLWGVLGIALCLPVYFPLAAETEQPVTMEAFPAFEGTFKYGEWLPVWVTLENHGASLSAEVQVSIVQDFGTTTYASAVELPASARKQVPVYVLPNNFTHELKVELIVAGETLLSQNVLVRPQPNIMYFTGFLAPERGALTLLQGVALPGGRSQTLIDLTLAELPERAEGLRSFNCLVFNGIDTSALTPDQAVALVNWVQNGGRLILGGGALAQQTLAGLPDSLRPVTPTGLVEIDSLTGLADFASASPIRVPGPFTVATGTAHQGESLAMEGDVPLVQEIRLGEGYVDFVALDLSVTPFDAWTGTTAFWETLITPGAAYPSWMPPDISLRQMSTGSISGALSNLPSLELPSVRSLGFLLALYILLVGPVNFLVLRWRKKLQLAWVTIPVITLVFTGLSFGIGYAKRGTDLIINKIAIIRAQSDLPAQVTSYIGLFSPANQAYQIEVAGDQLLSPLSNYYDPWGGGYTSGGNLTFLQGSSSLVRGLTVSQWSMQSFMTESSWQFDGQLQGNFRVEAGKLVGTVTNNTGYALRDVVVILQNSFTQLGELQAGASADVTLSLGNFQDMMYGASMSWKIYEEEYNKLMGAPSREIEFKRMVLEGVLDQQSMYGGGFTPGVTRSALELTPSREITLLGWMDEAPPEVTVNGETPQESANALYLIKLPYEIPQQGAIELPPGFIAGLVAEMPLSGGTCGASSTSIWMDKGEAVMEFILPVELSNIQLENLQLAIQTDSGWGNVPSIDLYEWQTETWKNLDQVAFGVNLIVEPDSLVSPEGLVRVRLTQEGANLQGGACFFTGLGLKGSQ